jgi:acetylornithine deacetylase/succinyl-diaminopimelate desuccinylase-like protein
MIELRRQGFTPTRSLVIAYSGDEETSMKTSEIIAERLRNARLVLNVDGSSGTLNEETGKPLFWSWEGAEKTYVDFQLEVTNAGGHSSAPRPENAIQQMSQALERIGAYRFKPEQNDITREYFAKAAALEPDPKLSAAMQAFAANPAAEEAIAVLRANPAMIGKIGTTCVPTMVEGGHAFNALPQRVTANVNCRIFPGHSREEIMAELERVAGVPEVKFRDRTGDESIDAPPSPIDPLLLAAVTKAVAVSWGKEVSIFPSQSSGASDSMWYRAVGVPSYGASASMSKHSDGFSHGLNERIALSNISPGVIYYLSVYKDLSSQ